MKPQIQTRNVTEFRKLLEELLRREAEKRLKRKRVQKKENKA